MQPCSEPTTAMTQVRAQVRQIESQIKHVRAKRSAYCYTRAACCKDEVEGKITKVRSQRQVRNLLCCCRANSCVVDIIGRCFPIFE